MSNPGQPTISAGSTRDAVRRALRRLSRTPDLSLAVDGIFGPSTGSAVKGFRGGAGPDSRWRRRACDLECPVGR